ncbi:TIGR03915 family putative DNA repair protein [Altibacter sp. HG106]|uniref:TIGR03915 family putative DNA repair protein n=1 Tax=Altibacter sp. HG106 TaxID=3023937 RepID=UPI0023500BD0|nr:TIGR03915 family putative DNA repair protein [Altibacter sp. HG106]MDC7994596.1 TIGR03915 family putative DNA repair protein [Altibacter sp. HG106]
MLLTYDGTFEGMLTAVFMMYEEKIDDLQLVLANQPQASLFMTSEEVFSDATKAARVWDGIAKKGGKRVQQLMYKVFLSELPERESLLISFLKAFFSSQGTVAKNPAHPLTARMLQIQKMIGREKHRMDAFIRFMQTKEGWYVATVAPDFNVLPLNVAHFKARYADQQWLIYDVKRNYGFYYNEQTVEEVQLEQALAPNLSERLTTLYLSEEELQFQTLWQSYFQHTNIASRKNTKLHLRHVPKRYWKYLTEKQPVIKK